MPLLDWSPASPAANSNPIRVPDIFSRAEEALPPYRSWLDRTRKSRLAASAGVSKAATTADLNASVSSASSASTTTCDNIVSRDTALKSSPVMNVAKRSTVPPLTLAHFE